MVSRRQREIGIIISRKKTICRKHIQRNVIFKKQHPRTWRVNGWKGSCSSSVFLSFDCNLEKKLSHRGAWVEGGRIWLWSACHYRDLSLSIFPCFLCLTLFPSPLCLTPRVVVVLQLQVEIVKILVSSITPHITVYCALCLYIKGDIILIFRFIRVFWVSVRTCLHALMLKKHVICWLNIPVPVSLSPPPKGQSALIGALPLSTLTGTLLMGTSPGGRSTVPVHSKNKWFGSTTKI